MTELRPGLELGARFMLVRRIGRGGNGEVWLAEDRGRGGQVALKALHSDWLQEAGRRSRLEQEFTNARTLPAELAVPVHELVEAGEHTLLVSEYQTGGDLGQFRGRGFVTWGVAILQVCEALEAAHAAGLVHRDLKCANVLLDGDGRARLADFGLATLAGSRVAGGGSPYNSSPQQLRGDPASKADDLYALGTMLYELIAAHPPYYPDISRDRVLHEPVPPLQPRAQVPVAIRELALRLLSKSSTERPDLAIVRAGLAAARDERPEPAPAHEIAAAAPSGAAPRGLARRWLPLAVLAFAAAAAAVFLWLPELVAGRSAQLAERAQGEAQAAAIARIEDERLAAEKAAAMAAAEGARAAFNEARKVAEKGAAARWATELYARARDHGGQAERFDAVADYGAAQAAWVAGSAVLAEIEKARPAALDRALAAGAAALARGDGAAARDAFGLALSIEPGQARATAGMARAGRLEEAFAAVDAAALLERSGRHAAAADGYRRALAIDADVAGAREGLARLAARQASDAYAAAMSRGFSELAAGRPGPARSAFERALALRPGAPEAREAIAQLELGQRSAALALLESRARSAEAAEDWAQALAAWQEAIALEPGLAAAREGLARSSPRAELAASIGALIQRPERLWTPAGRGDARALVVAARNAGPPNARLDGQAGELASLIASAETPVNLKLVSDGQTDVVIYRHGRLGAFINQSVELLPGRHVIVGTRRGYRDVRRELEIRPGAEPPPLSIRCEEPI